MRPRAAAELLGESGSKTALAKVAAAIQQMKAASVAPLLRQAIDALNRQDPAAAGELATKALELDERNGFGWYLLAVSRERSHDFKSSIQCYEAALQLIPDHAEVANDLGRLAFRLDLKDVAAKLFRHFIAKHPELPDGPNNLACALRDLGRYDEAIDALKAALAVHATHPLLWNTLGTVAAERGDLESAVLFFEEALRHQPGYPMALYNRGNALLSLGRYDEALADCAAAISADNPPDQHEMMRMARSAIHLCRGDLAQGWDDYEARLAPAFAGVTHFLIDRPRWTPVQDIEGKKLLLLGEQGLGDEVLFANMIPDILADLGPEGRLGVAVEPRLAPLFRRSFPTADIGPHGTYRVDTHLVRGTSAFDHEAFDLWAPMASPLRRYRPSLEAFPDRKGFLVVDPDRVAHWRAVLQAAPAGLKVGLLWKSMKLGGRRSLQFSPFEQWGEVLKTPGVCFVNLQYGDCEEELTFARETLGVDIWTPPGIDLKQDLDDLAALSCALDLVLGFANATSNIAAACGAQTWLIAIPGAWVQCGTDRYPWYPQARVFNPPGFGAWTEVMQDVAQALARRAAP